jgi:nitroreductase
VGVVLGWIAARAVRGWPRGDATFTGLVGTLTRGNRSWAPNASALVLGVTQLRDDEKVLAHSAFDLGQAVAQLALQAVAEGFVAHPMGGFDAGAARVRFAVPDDFQPLVLVAIGTLADPSTMEEGLRAKETRPRSRLPLSEVAFAGTWGQPAL